MKAFRKQVSLAVLGTALVLLALAASGHAAEMTLHIDPTQSTADFTLSDTLHTVHMTGAATLNLPFPFRNQVTSRKLPASGEAHLRCNGGHVWMNAEMFVVQHPYYAVTGPSGSFELTGVPPGEYELIAWHEGWTVLRQENSVDVLTQQRVGRPIFSEPKTWEKKVTVAKDAATPVSFTLSGKW